MQIVIDASAPAEVKADALAVLCFEREQTQTNAVQGETDPEVARQAGWLSEARSAGEFTGKLYESLTLHRAEGIAAARLVVLGAGKRGEFSPVEARRAAGVLVRCLKPKGIRTVALVLEDASEELVAAAVEGAIIGAWEADKYKTDPKKAEKQIDSFTLVTPNRDQSRLQVVAGRARALAEAQNFTRDLVNEPANRLLPKDLVSAATELSTSAGLKLEVLDREAMAQLGMGALLGVAQGSENAPFLIVLKYVPSSVLKSDHLALVGKGVTFDTGGISIKPADGMEKMKYDMAGAAAVLGAMKALAELKPPIPVTGYIPTVENMINGNAQRPGDIVTSLSGKTIEVLNTDAEGRLILADALTYANRNGATHLVDAATLTGAINVALGQYNMGAFTNDQEFLDRFLTAARAAGEKTWQMPMDQEYKEYLKSAFADLPNIGGRAAGSITAAWFLREFADPTPWVHLDIASTAWLDDAKPWISKGPTGVAVRSFVQLALHWK